MKNILFLTATPTVGGNGDALISAAMEAAKEQGANVHLYYNCMAAQMMTVINRLCCTFACKTYQIGPKKRVGVFLTCTGSEPEEMKRHVRNILTLPSVSRAISEYRTVVFTQCVSDSTCHDRADYLDRAKEIARWAAEV